MANTSILAAFERMWQHVVAAISGKSDINHTHDDMYYTEAEMDSKLDTVNASISNITSGSVSVAKANEAVRAISADEAVHATSADNANVANSATKATQDASGNVITDTYETKADSQTKLDSAKSYTDTKVSGLASTSVVDTKISTHNTSTSAHNDIRDLINGLTTRLNALADSDDTTLDQMSEIVDYIKTNKDLIDSITTSKVNVADIVNNLTTNVTNKPLSAAQGVAIKELIDTLQIVVDGKPDDLNDLGLTATATELNYMDGVTSGVQSQLDSKQPVITGGASSITNTNLVSHRALVSNSQGKVNVSDITSTELGYLDGVTSNVQTQFDTINNSLNDINNSILDTMEEINANTQDNQIAGALAVKEFGQKYLPLTGGNIKGAVEIDGTLYVETVEGVWFTIQTGADGRKISMISVNNMFGFNDDTHKRWIMKSEGGSDGRFDIFQKLYVNEKQVATIDDLAYATRVVSQSISTSILDKAVALSKGTPAVYQYHLSGSSYTGRDVPTGSAIYRPATIYVRSDNSVAVVLYDSTRIWTNYYTGSEWLGWESEALTSDLSNYLPLSGGTITAPLFIRKHGADYLTYRLDNGVRDVEFMINGSGNCMLYDNTREESILISTTDGSVYIPHTTYVGTSKDLVATCNQPTHTMSVFEFEKTYGTGSTPCDYGMIIIHGYSRPNSWNGDTYYFIVNHEGAAYNGWQTGGATSITWKKNINASNFSLSGTTLTITT